jgi:glycosyltransferase involved in cell wall biosynthesis
LWQSRNFPRAISNFDTWQPLFWSRSWGWYFRSSGYILATFIGRLEPAKGLDILERFCGLISHDRVHVLIQFPSENERYGREAGGLKRLDPEHIHLLPDVDPASERAIRHCDVLLTPSLSEVCPLVVLEAFHCGLNVIGTKATPFYEELPAFGMPPESYKFLELPSDVDVRRPREELAASSATAETIAQRLMEIARTLSAPDDDQRQATSKIIGRSPLAQDHMLQELQEVYADAVAANNRDSSSTYSGGGE